MRSSKYKLVQTEMCFYLCSQFLRLQHFDRFQIIFFPRLPKIEKLFMLRNFFQGKKENSNSASLKPSHQSNKFLYMAFSRGSCKENKSKQRNVKNYKRQAFFVPQKRDFCFHVCFNPKLPAKQQQFHCFREQCSKCVGVN